MPIIGLEDDVQALALGILSDAADAVMFDLLEAAPLGETGELVDSARGPEIDEINLNATVAFDSPHADYTDQGVGRHDIYGNPTLTFFWADGPEGPGVYNFAHVDHPGQAATHWFTEITDNWDAYVNEAAQ